MKVPVLASAQDSITAQGVQESATSVVPEGTILVVARSGILAHTLPVARAGRAVAFNQDIKAIQVSSDRVSSEYVYWFLRGKAPEVLSRGVKKGATVHSLQSGFLERLAIPLAPINEQRRIVDLLSRAEGIVRMRREAEAKAKEIIPALFLDMFGDPARNERGWEVRRLGDVADVVSGVAKGRKLGGKMTLSVPYLRVANVQAGHLDLSELKMIEATPAEIAELTLRAGDVLLTEGGDYDKLGRGALLEGDIGECIHQNHVFRVRAAAAALIPEYFASYLQADLARNYFLKSAKRTTNLASINMTQLRSLPVVLPPLPAQSVFARRVADCRSIEKGQAAGVVVAGQAFQSLLARMFQE
jgi:type I restriction enzyme S subunit